MAFWRRRWDSNPRAVAGKLISSQPRYDHFDTSPYSNLISIHKKERFVNQNFQRVFIALIFSFFFILLTRGRPFPAWWRPYRKTERPSHGVWGRRLGCTEAKRPAAAAAGLCIWLIRRPRLPRRRTWTVGKKAGSGEAGSRPGPPAQSGTWPGSA